MKYVVYTRLFYDIRQVCFYITMEFCHVIPNETSSSIAIGKSVTKRFFSIVENTVIFRHCLVFVHVVYQVIYQVAIAA